MRKVIKICLSMVFAFLLTFSTPMLNIAGSVSVAMAAQTPETTVEKVTLYVGYKTYQIKFKNLSKSAKLSFESSNTKIAKVSAAGIITPIAKGTANIKVTMKQNGTTYTSKIKVTVGVANVKITEKVSQLDIDDTFTFKAKAYGTSSKITWSTSNTKIAKINSTSGKLTTVAAGEVDVIATAGSVSSRLTLTVNTNRITTESKDLEIYDQVIINIKIKNLGSSEAVNFSSADPDIVTCKWGEIVGDTVSLMINPKKIGSTTVTIRTDATLDKLVINVKVVKAPTTRDKDAKVLTAKEIYKKCAASTVELQVTKFDGQYVASGFFIQSGVIITNYHVIEGATKVVVVTSSGKTYDMYAVLGYSDDYDLAIIGIDAVTEHLTVNKGGVSVGEVVYALGSPRGLTGSLSEGIVSSASRIIGGVDCIQVTAPISQGNSGGPLINEYGEVMGVNSFIVADGQNLNFAVNISQYNNIDANNGVLAEDYYKEVINNGITEDESLSGYTDTLQYVPSNVYVNGTLEVGDYIDAFKFTLDKAGSIYALMVTNQDNSLHITDFYITDTNQKLVADSTIVTYDNDQYREIKADLAAGEYYIMISCDYNMSEATNYVFGIEY